jgi:hypothetical protein
MSCRSAFKMSWQLQNHCIQIGLFNTIIEMEVCRKIVVFKLWSSCFQYQGQDEPAIVLYSWLRWISSSINNISKLQTIFIKCLIKNKCSPWHKSVLCNPCSEKKSGTGQRCGEKKSGTGVSALFACLISHQPTVLFSQNKPATSNQPESASSTLLSEQTSTSHQPQPTEQAAGQR